MSSSSASSKSDDARKKFLKELLIPAPERGKLRCRLCNETVWGPNGRYHPDKCPKILDARKKAKRENLKLVNVGGIAFKEELFKQLKDPKPKPAKVKGFVVSSSALRDDPRVAPNPSDAASNQRTGRKGYNRCLACNTEVFAPNTRRHERTCPNRRQGS